MAGRVVITETARQDLEHVASWYAAIDPVLWQRFAREFDIIIEHLSEFPFLGRVHRREWRGIPFTRFPYTVWCLVLEDGSTARIHRLLHDRRSPDAWPG